MTEFERGFFEEVQKIAAAMGTPTMPKTKGLEQLQKGTAAAGAKPLATAMRSPLSLITAMKPPKQTFYTGT